MGMPRSKLSSGFPVALRRQLDLTAAIARKRLLEVHFRHAMEQTDWPTFGVPGVPSRKIDYKPFDLPAVHIFKIQGGLIREIEAMGFLAPYNAPTGW